MLRLFHGQAQVSGRVMAARDERAFPQPVENLARSTGELRLGMLLEHMGGIYLLAPRREELGKRDCDVFFRLRAEDFLQVQHIRPIPKRPTGSLCSGYRIE